MTTQPPIQLVLHNRHFINRATAYAHGECDLREVAEAAIAAMGTEHVQSTIKLNLSSEISVVETLRNHITLLLPLAKGYAYTRKIPVNMSIIENAESVLLQSSPDPVSSNTPPSQPNTPVADQPDEWWKKLWIFAQAVANAPHGTSFKLTAQEVIKEMEELCRSIPSREYSWQKYPGSEPRVFEGSWRSYPLLFHTKDGGAEHVRMGYFDFSADCFYESGFQMEWKDQVVGFMHYPMPNTDIEDGETK
jgi:hypothetical protein